MRDDDHSLPAVCGRSRVQAVKNAAPELRVRLTAWPCEGFIRLGLIASPVLGQIVLQLRERGAFDSAAVNFARPLHRLWLQSPNAAEGGSHVAGTAQGTREQRVRGGLLPEATCERLQLALAGRRQRHVPGSTQPSSGICRGVANERYPCDHVLFSRDAAELPTSRVRDGASSFQPDHGQMGLPLRTLGPSHRRETGI